VKLIARIFAETGIRDLFALLHGVIRKHASRAHTVRLRNRWVTIDPREWKARNNITIHVGLGTGGKTEQLAHLTSLIGLQKEALAAGKGNLVSDSNLFNSAKEFVKLIGLKDVERYFTDPRTQPPPQPAPHPGLVEMQIRSEIEKTQARADIAVQQRKIESEMLLAHQRFALEKELKLLDAQLKVEAHQRNVITDALKSNEQVENGGGESPNDAAGTPANGAGNAVLIAALIQTMQRMSAPKRARKLADGSWVAEPAPAMHDDIRR